MDAETLLRELNGNRPYAHTAGGYWATWPDLDVRAMARIMREHVVRLVTITATPGDGDALRIIYTWDADGELVNLSTTVTSGHVPSISDIVPGADWAEREIRDYYGPEFDGRDTTPPLMLREGDPPGLFVRTRHQGNEADPAQTAHAAIAAEEGEHR
ncbi:NADH-quinone oxidoreductase subunit C [Streptomyces sp. YIM S03343]